MPAFSDPNTQDRVVVSVNDVAAICCRVCSARSLALSSLVSLIVNASAPAPSVFIIDLLKSMRACMIVDIDPMVVAIVFNELSAPEMLLTAVSTSVLNSKWLVLAATPSALDVAGEPLMTRLDVPVSLKLILLDEPVRKFTPLKPASAAISLIRASTPSNCVARSARAVFAVL